jgi:hypothetical protein
MRGISMVRSRLYLPLIILSLSLMNLGCGGGSYSSPAVSTPQPSPTPDAQGMQGSWTIAFHSDVSNDYTVLEANISQSSTHVYAGATSAIVYQGTSLQSTIRPTSFGSKCDSGAVGTVTLDGTLTNHQPANDALTFTLTQTGSLGVAVINASASTNDTQISDGTYTVPPVCGFPEDHGTFQGFQDSVKFSGTDTYTGTFQGDTTIVRFTSESSGFGLSATGTDNSAAFTLTGSATGFFLTLTGNISGQPVTWLVLYDSTYNTFGIYDSDANFLGSLSGSLGGSNPWDY